MDTNEPTVWEDKNLHFLVDHILGNDLKDVNPLNFENHR